MGAMDWLDLKQVTPSHPVHPHRPHSAQTLRACGHPTLQEGSEPCALRTETQRGRVGTGHWFRSTQFLQKHSGSSFTLLPLHTKSGSSPGALAPPPKYPGSSSHRLWFLPEHRTPPPPRTHVQGKAPRIYPRAPTLLRANSQALTFPYGV